MPVVLLIDSVSSHLEMKVFEYASLKGIELYRLHPNATRIKQRLDVGVFGPLKKGGMKCCGVTADTMPVML
ncbi:hypothetical protein DPMN_096876 [Dreissena polymorpha]|uniref:DDE-1 domain-containing protein n=1 Tax=Dreissena polymorpha TaxID=45954 RepID=A0A9D4R473_DREPO|nr:hypothetical protein DPMN_096876 [Dreissena polymorpha]